ncbi:MFS transporter [Bradyrhizobium sp. U87765 SZCCT0131]|uniref:MFS transporter n=1 Tax=unclassified Bradyrhizobium TaxID=2631580 RepID=UPI001BACD915|nr:MULTISPECIES: MFS transporter [unclassified Bradyrhizobium]MBR1218340.1 MFS transporter [Bradyrhizobium sp. U87765 SZCCT0131]MBR1260714.1 MFS transporter [Bradyrhizobium sp. U87765 SZCCT0134]MBR1303838.1 MFS transporter [Bradyrhizobium sp. U87765 SZCCT0110]MBR1319444.1 MFS transporter [Bradyrhizobium sp. U87765 SZCCT0109]MBR1347769.1 MFS transporter [Bradyrhizobium sp. U87765 SZCCT0048]
MAQVVDNPDVAGGGATPVAAAAYAKAAARLIPALVFLFILAWIDRVNVGFAKLTMLSDLKLSEAAYGFGAGIFFLSYFLFEVPSNLLLEKIGARKTLARITILWGLNCAAMAFVKTEFWFYVLRFTLGMFEAGFFPGVVLYLTYWFPAARRARINGLFMTSFAIAGIVGGPIAGLIMSSMGGVANLSSWQWLFILEGIPSVLAGIAVILWLPDRPREASWLSSQEAQAIERDLAADAAAVVTESSFKAALADWRVWLCALIYFGIVSGNATIAFWTPSIIKETGVTNALHIGLLAAIPFIAGTIAMVWNGAHSDRTGERRLHCAIAALVAAVGLAATGASIGSGGTAALVALTVAAIGILAAFPVFWTIPQALLAGTAAAGAIALINAIGNLAGFVAPYVIGISADVTGSATSGLYVVGAIELIAAFLVFTFCRWQAVKR